MNTLAAFMIGEANRGREEMVFDWDKAAQIIKDTGTTVAYAGLRDDWEYTGGAIFRDGKPVQKPDVFLASTWAVPELIVPGEPVVECYKMQSQTPGWHAKTVWPKSALDIVCKIIDGEKVEG